MPWTCGVIKWLRLLHSQRTSNQVGMTDQLMAVGWTDIFVQ